MKISGRKPIGRPASSGGAARSKGAKPGAADRSGSSDPSIGVSLSSTSQVVASANAALAALPDVRLERVSEIRLAVDNGTYHVESEVIAKRMVDESLRESALRGDGSKRRR